MGFENRKEQRVALKKEVMINGSIKAQGLDLSSGGLYVYTGRNFPSGQVVTVMLPLNAKFINLRARIQHAQQSVGMGLQFIDMTSEQKASIDDFIKSSVSAYGRDTKNTVMLVDDNEATRRMNKGRLVADGYTVQEARNGNEAVSMLEKEHIDLVVIDLSRDPMSVHELLSAIRHKPDWKAIPVLVLSSRSSRDDIQQAMDAGATEYLVKMMTPPLKLSQRVKAHLSEKH
jgi:CheY-like chemotaxis protein